MAGSTEPESLVSPISTDQDESLKGPDKSFYSTETYSDLEVVRHSELEVVQHDDGLQVSGSDGKQTVRPKQWSYEGLHFAGVRVSEIGEDERKQLPEVPAKAAWWRKRWVVILMAIALVIILAAAIVPVVVITTLNKDRGSDSPAGATNSGGAPSSSNGGGSGSGSSSSSSGVTTTPARIQAKSGAWNGTTLSAGRITNLPNADNFGFVIYQRVDGSLRMVRYQISLPSMDLLWKDSEVLTQDAANGTPVYSTGCIPAKSCDLQHFFVAKNGTLVDVLMPSDLVFEWGPGTLSRKAFKAPTDNRVILKADYDAFYGKTYNATVESTRLFAGGMDGAVHQYVFDSTTQTWSDSDTSIAGTWGYGSLLTHTDVMVGNQVSTAMFNTLENGTFQALWSIDGNNQTNQTTYPSGNWSAPLVASTAYRSGNNASVVYANPFGGNPHASLIFPGQDGKLANASTDLGQTYHVQTFGGAYPVDKTLPVMQGSDLSFLQWDEKNGTAPWVIFYQQNGSDVSWMTFNGSLGNFVNSGSLDTSKY